MGQSVELRRIIKYGSQQNVIAANQLATEQAIARAEEAQIAGQQALAAAGVKPDFISDTVGTLPDSAGAVDGELGAWRPVAGLYQLIEWDEGGEVWNTDKYAPFVTALGIKANEAADIRAFAGFFAGQIVFLLGQLDIGDGLEGRFRWDPDSEATDDGEDVFRPDTVGSEEPGRWHRTRDSKTVAEILVLHEIKASLRDMRPTAIARTSYAAEAAWDQADTSPRLSTDIIYDDEPLHLPAIEWHKSQSSTRLTVIEE